MKRLFTFMLLPVSVLLSRFPHIPTQTIAIIGNKETETAAKTLKLQKMGGVLTNTGMTIVNLNLTPRQKPQ